jgi:hypothetical protein
MSFRTRGLRRGFGRLPACEGCWLSRSAGPAAHARYKLRRSVSRPFFFGRLTSKTNRPARLMVCPTKGESRFCPDVCGQPASSAARATAAFDNAAAHRAVRSMRSCMRLKRTRQTGEGFADQGFAGVTCKGPELVSRQIEHNSSMEESSPKNLSMFESVCSWSAAEYAAAASRGRTT